MVQLVPGKPHRSKEPQVVVDNPLEPGRYRFSLVVLDDADNESVPFEFVVSVVEQVRPVLRPEILREEPILRRPIVLDSLRNIRPR
ncbi:MAG TPA: hypothetical protein VI168_08040 [Croceibacterium sp.]